MEDNITHFDCTSKYTSEILDASDIPMKEDVVVLNEWMYFNYPFERARNIIAFYAFQRRDWGTYREYKDKVYNDVYDEIKEFMEVFNFNYAIILDEDNPEHTKIVFLKKKEDYEELIDAVKEHCEPYIHVNIK